MKYKCKIIKVSYLSSLQMDYNETSRNSESLGEIGFPDLSKLSVHLKSSRLASDLTEDIPNTASL
jgi:hypothetical protein